MSALLPPFDLDPTRLEGLLARALDRGGDWADLFVERSLTRRLRWEEGRLKESELGLSAGIGIRVLQGEGAGYAYAEDPDPVHLEAAAATAARIAAGGKAQPAPCLVARALPDRYRALEPAAAADLPRKVALLERVHAAAAADSAVEKIVVEYHESLREIRIATSEGTLVLDRRPLLRIICSVVASRGQRREAGRASAGGRAGLELFDEQACAALGREAARLARVQLEAVDAPAGPMPVLLAAATSGVLLHEAVGHGLEADFNRKGVSKFSDLLGERVASEHCTVVDDPSLPGDRGALNVDDEGSAAEPTVLIEDGVLRGYLHDRLSARLLATAPTGNGRRQSYRHPPLPRMTCTYLRAGRREPEELIRSIRHGLYAKQFSGGQVDIARGDFVFDVVEGYLIEDGAVTAPVKGASLIGNGPEIMQRVEMVANDFALSPGMWTCNKRGQRVPVNVGLPHVKIAEINVGGTRTGEASG